MRQRKYILLAAIILLGSCTTYELDLTNQFRSVKVFFQDIDQKQYENEKDGKNWHLNSLDTAASIDDLSFEERNVVLELNKVRTDPGKYAELYLVPLRHRYSGNRYQDGNVTIITEEGLPALDECIEVLSRTRPVVALSHNEKLHEMAKDHVLKQGQTRQTGHSSPNGDSFQDRVRIWGKGMSYVGENISYGESSARDIVIQLLIDDGVPGRGHRENILNADYDQVGVSIGPHQEYAYMCVIDFGRH